MSYNSGLMSLAFAAMLSMSGLAAADEPTIEKLTSALLEYNQVSDTVLPVPSNEELETIILGDMINLRQRTSIVTGGQSQDTIRVVAYQLVERPRLLVWLATLNPTTQHTKRLDEYLVDIDESGSSIWYQHLDTPWPVSNRHWVISNVKDTQIARDTNDLVWEHNWRLTERGEAIAFNLLVNNKVKNLDASNYEKAIYLPANRGAWTMFSITDDVTLVAAQTTADMGGWIPDSWVANFASRQLSGVLPKLANKADRIHKDYTGETVVFTGAGVAISVEDAVRAQQHYRRSQNISP
ncbi:MAG: hypothetical protein AB8G18_00240 [Gammaproteobacteria bacterium]